MLYPYHKASIRQTTELRIERYIEGFVREYINLYRRNGSIQTPSSGDCWACLFSEHHEQKYKDKKFAIGDLGISHILNHLDEWYFVPSLLSNAIKYTQPNPFFIEEVIRREIAKGSGDLMREVLTSYFQDLLEEIVREAEEHYREYNFLDGIVK